MNLEYHDARQSRLGTGAGHCVALHDVQQYADAQLEKISFDDEHIAYGTSAQEGYHPMAMDGEVRRHGLILPSQRDADNDTFEMDSNEVKPLRRKRHSHRKIDPPYSPSKITKRPSGSKRRSCSGAKASSDINTSAKTNIHRTFHCPFALYGCQSTFGSKNEWKRHVSTQHMRLGYWRCDQCPHSNHRPNDFNRKDLFIQHVRRMHAISTDDARLTKKRKAGNSVRGHKDDAEEAELANIARRCHRQLRSAPERSSCLFCDARFDGASSWEERMEHVGKHMEAAKKTEEAPKTLGVWRHDQVFEDWLLAEGLVVRVKGRVVLADMQ
ncbi:hypothetical protein B0A50_01866 [Salinomyces thailandicus]|uniref:C2H2-type domain-containing protein n=1 Tax=Salinomyces thailandicus TaxID=706561 RepID=A0A4U0U9L5_9PEZI|nr:hypothetical protein B0A50_01866 [Salinomyces thailandica]